MRGRHTQFGVVEKLSGACRPVFHRQERNSAEFSRFVPLSTVLISYSHKDFIWLCGGICTEESGEWKGSP